MIRDNSQLCSTGNFSATAQTEAGISTALPRLQAAVPVPSLHPQTATGASQPLQPVRDVAEYLATRKPQPHFSAEQGLWITVPEEERANVTSLLAAFHRVLSRTNEMSVTRACKEVRSQTAFKDRHWNEKTFRALFDTWNAKQDWVCLVNRSKCNALWKKTNVGLRPEFLKFCAQRFGQFIRKDAKRQALLSIKRQWRTGRNTDGKEEVIPGYESGWSARVREVYPPGWHYSNILRQIKKGGLFTSAHRAMLHESNAAATQFLPQILGTRANLRFLERVTFDDVRTDWWIFNTKTGQPEELWLLVARDTASAMILGFVMHPATERPDGSAVHLGLKQMKQLAGWLLERYPLPPYVVHWIIERGTATLSEGVCMALGELFGNRIVTHFTSMIGGRSPVGYKEKAKGNSRGKASHESHNRLFHTQGAYIAGQIGNRWDVRPADLKARGDEAVEIWQMRERLPEHLRGQEQYPLLTIPQAREHLGRICHEQNLRDEHQLEGFEQVLEWFDGQNWQPQSTYRGTGQIRTRMERPYERALRLMHGHEWSPVSPAIVAAFYEHSEKIVHVEDDGEIVFKQDGRQFTYRHGGAPLVPGSKALAYFHEDDPRFLHLTDGKGSILGTWIRRERVSDLEALQDAFRYTGAAKAAAQVAAAALAQPQTDQLAAMRAHNEELMKLSEFTDVTEAPQPGMGIVGSPAGAALVAVSQVRKDKPKRDDEVKSARRATREAFMSVD